MSQNMRFLMYPSNFAFLVTELIDNVTSKDAGVIKPDRPLRHTSVYPKPAGTVTANG
ncbi:hypothetical protein FIV00_00095 [Labrenzia sp. THAF82]|nr:hypothetical protein FIV00_00095 [Labrenzia sp. THAF82]